MAPQKQAARALLFMQQCRRETTSNQLPIAFPRRNASDASRFSPENFGKKLRFEPDNRISEWRIKQAGIEMPKDTYKGPERYEAEYRFPRNKDFPAPRGRYNPNASTGFYGFLKYKILRLAEPPMPETKESLSVHNNPYRTKKKWPPDVRTLSELQQFRYEKTYRRRAYIKALSRRYNWDRYALFARRFAIAYVFFHFAFIAEPASEKITIPAHDFRWWFYRQWQKLPWLPEDIKKQLDETVHNYEIKHYRHWDPYNHTGWDTTRAVNTLPGKPSPAINRPLEPIN